MTSQIMMVERWAPLDPAMRSVMGMLFGSMAERAEGRNLPVEDLAMWQRLRDSAAPDCLLDDPEFGFRFGEVVVVGRLPAGEAAAIVTP